MARSLKVRSQCIPAVKASLLRNGFPSQKILAEDLGVAQSTVSNFLNGKPVDYANFVEICRSLGQEWRNIADFEEHLPPISVPAAKVKVAIGDRSTDSSLVHQLQQSLITAGHEVFIPPKNTTLQDYLKLSDYFLLLLSPESIKSEILLEELLLAKELQHFIPQKPAILPIYINFSSSIGHSQALPLPFDLLQLIQEIPALHWCSADETSILVAEILSVLTEGRTSFRTDRQLALTWTKISYQDSAKLSEDTYLAPRSTSPPVPLLRGEGSKIDTPPAPILRGEESETDTNTPPFPPCREGGSGELGLPTPLPVAAPEIPEGQVEIASQFYIERLPIETRCYETITQPGALIRIKAPRQMGKTSLMARILHHAEQQGGKTIALSFQLANKRVFTNSDTFLQWFCASVGQELGMLEQLVKCWELAEIIGSNQCCKAYFDRHLLPEIPTSLTLGLDEVDRVFESPEIADDFFGLLRALHEEAKRRDIWKKFRLIVVHSTEVYIPLDMNKSPFNVGLPIELPEFNLQQVQELSIRHGLNWHRDRVEKLMALVGGHPYLVRLAMYHIARQDVSLEQLLAEGATEAGIYSDHLRRHLWNLEKYPELLTAMKEVVSNDGGVRLRSEQAFKLNSMGLIKLDGNNCTPRCSLYAQYFRN